MSRVPTNSEPAPTRPIRVTLAEQTAEILRERIVWGEVPPGARMIEVDLAKELGVSRTPVREALQRLENDGLLVRQGTTLFTAPFDEAVAVETLIMRELLEPFAAEQSVQRMGPADLDALRAILGRMNAERSAQATPRQGAALNIEFHSVLNACCPYRRIVDAIQVARDTSSALRLYSSYTPEDIARVDEEHAQIVAAVEDAVLRDGDAAVVGQLIGAHMRSAREALLRNTTSDLAS